MTNTKNTVLVLGGDGYLGWSVGLALANRTEYHVVLVDSMIKREWEKEVDAKLLVPFAAPQERIGAYEQIFKKDNLSFEKICLLEEQAVQDLVARHRPVAIINAAQQPSAPFSMMSAKNSNVTFKNNIIGHLNVLWAIREVDPNILYVKLGSAGCYMDVDTSYLPLSKVDFSFEHNGKEHKVNDSWLPMQATDFYHQSKISDFLISDLCAKTWGLRTITVQQSTIFGATIEENRAAERHGLSTRFNYDAVFSTVLNRFVCQLAIGHPLTVYGDGTQRTGIISLSDSVASIISLLTTEVALGEHQVIHNYTHRLSIREIAERLTKVAGAAEVHYIPNPRKESNGTLSREVEVHEVLTEHHERRDLKLDEELVRFAEFARLYKDSIDTSIILPKVCWTRQENQIHVQENILQPQHGELNEETGLRSDLAFS
jgi:UDP-sulfoquinovose synthase